MREACFDTIKELNQELFDLKEQYQELERVNKQLLIENENLNDRSIVVGHHSAIESKLFEQEIQFQPTIDNYPQYKPVEQNHRSIETIPLIYQHNQTQVDPIHMINQQNQTESLFLSTVSS